MSQCPSDQRDLVLARAIFQYLSLGNLRDANKIMDEVKHGMSSQDFEDLPLVRCLKFLLLTLERDALPLFRMLRENYKMSIERDPSLDELLDDIAEKFYGVRRKSGFQNMFGDIMKMFIN
ncbi:hypothetical protein O6H91_Y022100 [Diphasiastrum complanatum]|nr:hypothetical protein O6H91_Y022100 [Diphasiastrum complanatum]